MNCILVLGAGFSRNWGGFLAPEAFDYLLGCPQVDAGLRDLLWRHKAGGGFEGALAELQADHIGNHRTEPEPPLRNLQSAILQMFKDMDEAFAHTDFEFQNVAEFQLWNFLARFDAIFTLNQDLLFERHYLDGKVELSAKWDGWIVPGMKRRSASSVLETPKLGEWVPDDPSNFSVTPRNQPYFKLHGSSNWFDTSGQELLVLGGNKASTIILHPILRWTHEQFEEYLSRPNTRLMVIGYGFGDDHINAMIRSAAAAGELRIFLVDPLGVDVIDKNRDAVIHAPDKLAVALQPHVLGSSVRSLRETFSGDHAEHSKLVRFIS